jgi:HPt (histidine-containing phosphotransfer) domain-containing protein
VAQPQDLAGLAGFDTEAGVRRMGGNRQLFTRLVRDFGKKYAGRAAEIEAAIRAKDWQQAHQLTHDLKGVAGNLGATDLFEAAQALEAAVRSPEGEQEAIPDRQGTLERLLAQAVASACALPGPEQAASAPSPESAPLAPELARETARRVREAADIGDLAELAALASGLPANSYYAARIQELGDAFDLDGLSALADEIENGVGATAEN